MRISFHASIDEITTISLHQLKNSKVVRRWRWQGPILVATGNPALCLAVLPEPLQARLIIGILAGIIGSVLAWYLNPYFWRKRTRKLVVEKHGKTNGVDCEVELREEGFWARTSATAGSSTQFQSAWADLNTVVEEPDWIEITIKEGNQLLALIPKRVFESDDQMRAFLAQARALQQAANATPA